MVSPLMYAKAIRASGLEVRAALAVIEDAVKVGDVITRTVVSAAFDYSEQPLAFAVFLRFIVLLTILDQPALPKFRRVMALPLESFRCCRLRR